MHLHFACDIDESCILGTACNPTQYHGNVSMLCLFDVFSQYNYKGGVTLLCKTESNTIVIMIMLYFYIMLDQSVKAFSVGVVSS